MNIDLNELRNNEGTEFDIKLEEENIEDNYSNKEGIEVFNKEFFSKAKIEAETANPFNLDEIESRCERLTEDGGVLKLLTKRGVGDLVPPQSSVLVKYSAYVEFADEPFVVCKSPVTIDLGSSMLKGMNIALASMRKGEKASFYIQPQYAYGKHGYIKPGIPSDSLCLFLIEMLSYEERGGAGEYFQCPPAERKNIPLSVMLGIGNIKKKEAQRHFKRGDFERAKSIYETLIKDLENYETEENEEKLEHKDLLLKLLCNNALCLLRMGDLQNCVTMAEKALSIDQTCAKALYFKAKALKEDGNVEGALDFMMKAHKIAPKNNDVNKQLQEINELMGERNKDEKKVYQKMMLNENEDESCDDDFDELPEEIKQDIETKLKNLKESENLSQSVSLSKAIFTEDELNTIAKMAKKISLRTYSEDEALVISKL